MSAEADLVAAAMADGTPDSRGAATGGSGAAHVADDAAAAAAASALEHNIKTKGGNAYYYAHASNIGGKELRAYHEPVGAIHVQRERAGRGVAVGQQRIEQAPPPCGM
jgi:hypothetical protein